MPSPQLRVGIVGCGSAGPAVALFLARAGHEVEIFERAPALGPVGTGFLLQPTGLRVLEALGLRDEAIRFGARVRGLNARTARGRLLLDLHYEDLCAGAHGLGMQRATLLDILVRALESEGVPIRLGSEIQAWHDDAAGRWLETDASQHGPFDLVIIANGARSLARGWTGLPHRAKPYPWGALWTLVPDPERRHPDHLTQVVDGTRTMLGYLPSGSRSDGSTQVPMLSIFWSVYADDLEEIRTAGVDALHAAIRRLDPEALLPPADDMECWRFAEYVDVVMPRWHAPGWAVLGDAAHAMSPQLGQGVNLALWDAWTLARCIETRDSLAAALAAYSPLRRAHLAFYQRATRWLTPFFQSSTPGAGLLRDLVFPIVGQVPPLQRQMLRSMAGLKRGLLRRSYPSAPQAPE